MNCRCWVKRGLCVQQRFVSIATCECGASWHGLWPWSKWLCLLSKRLGLKRRWVTFTCHVNGTHRRSSCGPWLKIERVNLKDQIRRGIFVSAEGKSQWVSGARPESFTCHRCLSLVGVPLLRLQSICLPDSERVVTRHEYCRRHSRTLFARDLPSCARRVSKPVPTAHFLVASPRPESGEACLLQLTHIQRMVSDSLRRFVAYGAMTMSGNSPGQATDTIDPATLRNACWPKRLECPPKRCADCPHWSRHLDNPGAPPMNSDSNTCATDADLPSVPLVVRDLLKLYDSLLTHLKSWPAPASINVLQTGRVSLVYCGHVVIAESWNLRLRSKWTMMALQDLAQRVLGHSRYQCQRSPLMTHLEITVSLANGVLDLRVRDKTFRRSLSSKWRCMWMTSISMCGVKNRE